MKKLIFIITLLFYSALAAQGFIAYDVNVVSSIDSLTLQQVKSVVDAFAQRKSITKVQFSMYLNRSLIKKLYRKIRAIEVTAVHLMQNYDIKSVDDLKTQVGVTYARANYVINKMILYSKRNGSGDWDYYKSQFGE